jgi:hypothetical protein
MHQLVGVGPAVATKPTSLSHFQQPKPRSLSHFQQTTTSAQDFAAAGKAGCSIGGGSTAVVSA